jgi:hypothetical protein
MSDNRIISKSEYIVNSISSTDIDNKIIRRPYTDSKNPSTKKQSTPNSFNDALHSFAAYTSSTDNSATFSNELENMARLKSKENARIVQARFNNDNNLNLSATKKISTETELFNKFNQAMNVEPDFSAIYTKLELLHSLKNHS